MKEGGNLGRYRHQLTAVANEAGRIDLERCILELADPTEKACRDEFGEGSVSTDRS